MKTKAILNCCAALMLCLAPKLAMGDVSHSCTFTLSDWSRQVEDVQGYLLTTHRYAGLLPTPALRPGLPLLPSRRVTLAVPYNATAFTVTVTDSTATDTLETFTVKPVPQPRYRDESADEEPPVFDPSVYGTDAFFPASPVMLGGEGYYMGEHHLLTLEVYPMRYNPVTRQLRRYTSLAFTVSWTISASQAAHAIIRSGSQGREQSRAEVQSMVVNPGQVAQFAPPIEQSTRLNGGGPVGPIGPEDPNFGGELYCDGPNYTIITTDSLKHALRKLVALKRQKGYSVTVKTVAEIEADSTVADGDCVALNDTCSYIRDTAGKMRQWLRNSFRDNNTQYVLMAGKDVPFRYGGMDTTSYAHWSYVEMKSIPTDWYFSDLNSNWNKNGNRLYGEPLQYISNTPDSLPDFDMNAELGVGRLMAANPSDIENYSKKLLCYELNPGNGNTEYLGKSLGAFLKEFYKGKDSVQIVYSEMQNAFENVDSIIMDKDTWHPYADDIIRQINETKYGFIHFDTHGRPSKMAIKYSRRSGDYINCLHALSSDTLNARESSFEELQNWHYPSIVFSSACHTTPFESYFYEEGVQYHVNRNMSQSFTMGGVFGGVAYIGHTRDSKGISVNKGSTLLYRSFLSQVNNSNHILSKILSKAKHDYAGNTLCDETLNMNLMGDPEFEIWTHSLTPFSGVTVSRGNHGVTVSGIDAGGDVATVSICNNTNQFQLKTYGNSVAFALFDPNSLVMVRAHGKLPYIAPFVLQNTTINKSQYVIASDVVAGRSVDSGRTAGDVTIAAGVDYEIEHKGTVTLAPGFKVEKGATFSVTPSEY